MTKEDGQAEVQRHARALADPTRFRIFTYILESADPVGVAELTDLFDFNHNAIRHHLTQLVESGLVSEETEVRDRPGRPRLLYTSTGAAFVSLGKPLWPQEELAGLLLELVQSGDTPYEVGKRLGEQYRSDGGESTSVATVVRDYERAGFQPVREGSGFTFRNCPVADLAAEGPTVVCELHRGVIDGSVGVTATLHLEDPHEGGCRVELPTVIS